MARLLSADTSSIVKNASGFFAGYFEELTAEQIECQLATSLTGPMNVTRAVLPVMRRAALRAHRLDLRRRWARRLRVLVRLRRLDR
jgi:NAD(P)-dependent dehydrogenase (short-subunit alcohol dehydrogenase family)